VELRLSLGVCKRSDSHRLSPPSLARVHSERRITGTRRR